MSEEAVIPNKGLITKVWKRLTVGDGWDQGGWRDIYNPGTERCETKLCFAGWAAQEAGLEWVLTEDGIKAAIEDLVAQGHSVPEARRMALEVLSPFRALVFVEDRSYGGSHPSPLSVHLGKRWAERIGVDPERFVMHVKLVAPTLLGLTEDQADQIFFSATYLDDIAKTLEPILGDHPDVMLNQVVGSDLAVTGAAVLPDNIPAGMAVLDLSTLEAATQVVADLLSERVELRRRIAELEG